MYIAQFYAHILYGCSLRFPSIFESSGGKEKSKKERGKRPSNAKIPAGLRVGLGADASTSQITTLGALPMVGARVGSSEMQYVRVKLGVSKRPGLRGLENADVWAMTTSNKTAIFFAFHKAMHQGL